MLSPDELEPMVLSPVVLCSVVLGSIELVLSPLELSSVEPGLVVLSSLVLAPDVLSSVEVCSDELGPVDVGSKDVDSDEFGSVELGPPLLGDSVELGSMDVDSDASEEADEVGSNELDNSVSEAVELKELEDDSWSEALVRDEASELAGMELVAPGELDCVSLVSGGLEVVRRSLVEVLATCSVEDDSKLLSVLELGFRLSDSLLPLLVCSSEDVDETRLLTSDVLASVVVLSRPDEELDSASLD